MIFQCYRMLSNSSCHRCSAPLPNWNATTRPFSMPPAAWLLPLGRLHVQWEADLTAFRSALLGAGVSQKSQDMILPGIEGMAQQIGRLKARLQAS